MNKMQLGVIVISKSEEITYLNLCAKKILNYNSDS